MLLALLPMLAPAAAAPVEAENVWIREVPPVSPAAALFVTLTHAGSQPLRVLSMSSPFAERVEWHDMTMAGGVMRMQRRRHIVLPAQAGVSLAPGGSHLMLQGLKQPLRVGMTVPVTLVFERGRPLTIQAIVRRSLPAAGKTEHHHH